MGKREERQKNKSVAILKPVLESILGKFHKMIKSVWLISKYSEKEIVMGILIDDTKLRESDIKELELWIVRLSEKIQSQYNKKIYFIFELLKDYFEKIMQNRLDVFSELENSIVLYDPTGFLRPIQKLVAEGKIVGTRQSVIRLIMSVKKRLKSIEGIKINALGKMYESVIDSAEAALVAKGLAALTPKQISRQLEKFSKKKILAKKYVDYYNDIYSYYKQYEHDEVSTIDGKKLDKMVIMADRFIDRMKDLCREFSRS